MIVPVRRTRNARGPCPGAGNRRRSCSPPVTRTSRLVPIRYSFLVVARDGRLISKPTADVWIARGFKEPARTSGRTARLEPVGVPGRSTITAPEPLFDLRHAPQRPDGPGTYWVLARTGGDPKVSGLGNIVVRKRSYAPAVGEQAPALAHADAGKQRTARLSQLSHVDAPRPAAVHDVGGSFRPRCAQAVRRRVRDSEVLHEPDVRAGRRRRVARA